MSIQEKDAEWRLSLYRSAACPTTCKSARLSKMQILARDKGAYEIKLKDTTIHVGESLTIGDYQLPGPGEYEVGGVMAEATGSCARLYVEDVTIGYLAKRGHKLTDQELEELGPIDILFFPLGADALAPKTALEILAQIEAPLMIPLATSPVLLEEFCTAHGHCENQTGPLKITRSQLPTEGSRVITFVP